MKIRILVHFLIIVYCFTFLSTQLFSQPISSNLEEIFRTNRTPIWDYSFLLNTTKEFLETAQGLEEKLVFFEDRNTTLKEKEAALNDALSVASINKELAEIGIAYAKKSQVITRKNVDIALQRIVHKESQLRSGKVALEYIKGERENRLEVPTKWMKENIDSKYWKYVALNEKERAEIITQNKIANRLESEQIAQLELEILELKSLENLAQLELGLNGLAVSTANKEKSRADVQYQQARDRLIEFRDEITIPSEIIDEIVLNLREMMDIYISYSIVLAKLTEKAYQAEEIMTFQNDIIKDFQHYTTGTTGKWLASDRILLDINTIEFNRITQKKQKQNFTTHTVLLKQKDPFEFRNLLKTGRMFFEISQFDLDQAFPGTFARVIERIDISVIALTDPYGIKGSLTKEGLSWKKVPNNVAGYFSIEDWIGSEYSGYKSMVFDDETETMIFPKTEENNRPLDVLKVFEGKPVSGTYTLELPTYSNTFDYNTIADVIIKIHFGAYYDSSLKSTIESRICEYQETEEIGFSQNLEISIKYDQPDDWYEFRNPINRDSLCRKRRYIPIYLFKNLIPSSHLNPLLNSLKIGFMTKNGYRDLKFSITSESMNEVAFLQSSEGYIDPARIDSLEINWLDDFHPLIGAPFDNPNAIDTIYSYSADTTQLLSKGGRISNFTSKNYDLWLIKIEASDNSSLTSEVDNLFDDNKLKQIVDININFGYEYTSDICRLKGRRYAWMNVDTVQTLYFTDYVNGNPVIKESQVPFLYVIKDGVIERQSEITLGKSRTYGLWETDLYDKSFKLIDKEINRFRDPINLPVVTINDAIISGGGNLLQPQTRQEEVIVQFDLKEVGDTVFFQCNPFWLNIKAWKTREDKIDLEFSINRYQLNLYDSELNSNDIQFIEHNENDNDTSNTFEFHGDLVELRFKYIFAARSLSDIDTDQKIAVNYLNIYIPKSNSNDPNRYSKIFKDGVYTKVTKSGIPVDRNKRPSLFQLIHLSKNSQEPHFILKGLEFWDLSRF